MTPEEEEAYKKAVEEAKKLIQKPPADPPKK